MNAPVGALLSHDPIQLYQQGMAHLAAGRVGEARSALLAAARRLPTDYEVRYALYAAIKAAGDDDLASLTLIDAMRLHAEETVRAVIGGETLEKCRATARGMVELGQLLYGKRQVALASYCFQIALTLDDSQIGTWLNLGLSLQHQARVDEAVAVFRNAVDRWPDHAAAHSFLHFALCFGVRPKSELIDEGRRWNERHVARRQATCPGHGNDRNPDRRLRVGYFSPLFSTHQMTQFFEPVLESHDPREVEIFCYSGSDHPADVTQQRIRKMADHWRLVGGMTDTEFVGQVRADGIDILVDLWGHTAGNRLTAFAFKPAPVQVSYLNYVVTTGMAAMDYVIHPRNYHVPGEEAYLSEAVMRVGDILCPFQPLEGILPSGPTPALERGYVTFGCFNHPAKVNDAVVALWSRILKAVPASRLLFQYGYFEDLVVQRAFRARFEAHGVSGDRIEFGAYRTGLAFIHSYHELDLCLDPFPYQGGTTTMDALTAGVPTLSHEGDWFRQRIATTNLRACGLDELVVPTHDAYVDLAIALANDLPRLDAIRQRVRPGLDTSPLRDPQNYTRKLETAYREAFRAWCESA